MQQWRPENAAMTFDELSLERSKAFVQALQELKNLRPQLYSAAEYCEKSYLHSEQKQMVLDNLKEYAVRTLVNAVDHLGTVAYKLTDLAERQSSDISTVELKISCLSQQLYTCQTFTYNEGLRQQQLFSATTRHKQHYTFPIRFFQEKNGEKLKTTQGKHSSHFQSMPSLQISGIPPPKPLSWHLSSENYTASRHSHTTLSVEDSKACNVICDSFHPLEEVSAAPIPLSSYVQVAKGHPLVDVASRIKDPLETRKSSTGFKTFEHSGRRGISQTARRKSILSAFFPGNKTLEPLEPLEPKRVPVS